MNDKCNCLINYFHVFKMLFLNVLRGLSFICSFLRLLFSILFCFASHYLQPDPCIIFCFVLKAYSGEKSVQPFRLWNQGLGGGVIGLQSVPISPSEFISLLLKSWNCSRKKAVIFKKWHVTFFASFHSLNLSFLGENWSSLMSNVAKANLTISNKAAQKLLWQW